MKALGHDFTEWTVEKEPTETEEGLEVRTCEREGCEVREERAIPKLPVTPDKVDKSALENTITNVWNTTKGQTIQLTVGRYIKQLWIRQKQYLTMKKQLRRM